MTRALIVQNLRVVVMIKLRAVIIEDLKGIKCCISIMAVVITNLWVAVVASLESLIMVNPKVVLGQA